MNHALFVHVLQAKNHACQHELSLLLTEAPSLPNMKTEIASRQQIADQVQIFSILERVVDVDKEWMLELL